MKNRSQAWCLIIGVGMFGPVFLGLAITCLFVGEIPGKKGPLIRVVDSPAIFYFATIAFIAVAAKMTQVSWHSARFFYNQGKRRGIL
jgi:hypothetical protein